MKQVSLILLLLFSLPAGAQTATLESFGAKGDGMTNDYAAIAAALASGNTTIQGTAGKTYVYGTPIAIPSGKTFDGRGATLKAMSTLPVNADYIHCKAPFESTVAHSVTVTAGSSTFTSPHASAAWVGRILKVNGPLRSQELAATGKYFHGLYGVVQSVVGTTVTMSHPAMFSFTGTGIRIYLLRQNVTVQNWRMDFTAIGGGKGLTLNDVKYLTVKNVELFSNPRDYATLKQGFNIRGVNVLIDSNNIHDGVLSTAILGNGAYAMDCFGQEVMVSNNTYTNWNGGIVAAFRDYTTKTMTFRRNTCNPGSGGQHALNFHGNAGGRMEYNTINTNFNLRDALTFGNSYTTVIGNTITYDGSIGTDNNINAISVGEHAVDSVVIKENIVTFRNLTVAKTLRGIYLNVAKRFPYTGAMNNMIIENNVLPSIIMYSTGKMGINILIRNNCFNSPNSRIFPFIDLNMTSSAGYGLRIEDNTFVNPFNNTYNFSIRVNSIVPTELYVVGNNIYKTNTLNNQEQVSLGTTTNVTNTENTVYSSSTPAPTCPITQTADVTDPVIANPTLSVTNITQTTARVTWTAATDNITAQSALVYSVSVDGVLQGTVTGGTSLFISGLTAGTPYTISVSVADLAGNTSDYTNKAFIQ